jgi:hypothetical protein
MTTANKVNGGRLTVAVLGMLLYLLGGATLGWWCFARNARTQPPPAGAAEADDPKPPAPPRPPRQTVTVDAEEQRKIDDAIVKGVWYLRNHALPQGGWGDKLPTGQAPVTVGYASLAALTLLECGIPPGDPIIQKAADLVRKQAPQPQPVYDTYQRALAILFLDRLGESRDNELIQYLAVCLIAGQQAIDNGWSYYCPAPDRKQTQPLLQQLREEKQSLADWRTAALNGAVWDQGGSDNSNTQFAVLALWVARRHKVAIDKPIALVDKRFRDTQFKKGPDPDKHNVDLDGSWYYNTAANARGWQAANEWPTMTCAGLLGLAVARGVAPEGTLKDKPLEDDAVKRALGMLGREIGRPDEKRATDLYFLWSLERVGVLYNLKQIEGKDWYAWGRKALLSGQQGQQDDGSWPGGIYYAHNPLVNTCFALLFLKQADLAQDLSDKLQLLAEKK